MTRRQSMCATCPFRGSDDAYKKETSEMPAKDWPCHEEDLFRNDQNTQCRGHFEAQRKFPKAMGETK